MVSSKKKGDDTEKQIMAILESQSYLVMRSPRTMKRVFLPGGKMIFVSQANDFFGLFDLCAKESSATIAKEVTLSSAIVVRTYWIQTKYKTPDNVYTAKKDIETFCKRFCGPFEYVEIWLKVPRTGFIIYKYIGAEWIKEYRDLKGYPKEQFNTEVK